MNIIVHKTYYGIFLLTNGIIEIPTYLDLVDLGETVLTDLLVLPVQLTEVLLV